MLPSIYENYYYSTRLFFKAFSNYVLCGSSCFSRIWNFVGFNKKLYTWNLFLLTYADFRFTWKYIYPELCYSLLSWHYLFKNLYHEIGINLNIIKCFNSISISLIWPPYVCPIFIFSQRKRGLYINVIDNRRCDQNWTIQRHGQHWTPGKEL